MLKKLKFVVVTITVLSLSACSGLPNMGSSGGSGISFNQSGTRAGTMSVEDADKYCSDQGLDGKPEYQTCMAHARGLYSRNADGSARENYVREVQDPAPATGGRVVTCTKRATYQNGAWKYSSCR